MPNAARVGDASSHGGVCATGSGNVFINGAPAAVMGGTIVPCPWPVPPHGAPPVACGSGTVFINNMPAARLGDVTGCGAVIVCGSPNVKIDG